ncbi:carbohydrate porin [Agaribacterium haliotis]|uniref:carbohydrate porin n=1 Tax=Agaribacterium haliotis TaxID=2013869 RepID=UPI0013041133|nr:carbohydrate porin [Agaribacterium haliotis]
MRHIICAALFTLSAGSAIPGLALSSGPHQLELDGYIRHSVGMSQSGAEQVSFQAPGAQAKYRFGNEADSYGELAVDYHYREPSATENDLSYQLYFMQSAYSKHGEDDSFSFDNTEQLYLKFNNVLPGGADVWMGKRYFDRRDLHLLDYYWLNTVQGAEGALGLEGVKLFDAEFTATLIRSADELQAVDGSMQQLYTTGVDLRLLDYSLSERSQLSFWALINERHENKTLGLHKKNGVAAGSWLIVEDVLHGELLSGLTLRSGAAVQQNHFGGPQPVRDGQDRLYEDNWALEWVNQHTVDVYGNFAVQSVLLYALADGDVPGQEGSRFSWFSMGSRPMYRLSKYGMASFELGLDHVNDDYHAQDGFLVKTTLAYELKPEFSFYQRPALRFFATYASWSDAFVGQVGGAAYLDSDEGWTLGTQLEHWW